SEINKVSSDYDLIITSDVKWSDWLTYSELQTPILEISHLSEQAFVYDIYSQLKEHFPDRNISMVEIDKEPYSNI
ncbi:Nif3-like dinuclear metal center hexameric protein, partial [Mycoplasma bovis]|nr:Nif3-like dinuclear metal center hexameric protein [Mycoplasmopsis bovis]